MYRRVLSFCALVVLFLFSIPSSSLSSPLPVSPGEEGSVVTIAQECPTFSWSSQEGAAAYTLSVFELMTGGVLSYEECLAMGPPVLTKRITAPALSYTPPLGQCFTPGLRYVWYVTGLNTSGTASSSPGRVFEVDVALSADMKEALSSYLTKEWVTTQSFQSFVEKVTTLPLAGKEGARASATGSGITGSEGISNTFYGTGAGASTTGDDDGATFIGAYAGNKNTTGASNTFVGAGSGSSNSTGSSNTFLGKDAGNKNTTGDYNTFLGATAGSSNTTSYYNTFVGTGAGTSNTTGASNTFVGAGSGSSNSTGYYNTFVGTGSGSVNTMGASNTFVGAGSGLSNTTGAFNTLLGAGSGYANTAGSSNTFLGRDTGFANTTGSSNTFVGNNAGSVNTTGASNTFVGASSGLSNTTGSANTFIGISSGAANTTGNYNTFLGRSSGAANTTGLDNTFIGSSAGDSTTTGSYNTFLGTYAGKTNTAGKENTFLGRSAGFLSATGRANIFLGSSAGYSTTTGSQNTFVGTGAGRNTTGSSNVFLGYRAGYNETGSNRLYISNSDTATPLIYGEFDAKKVKINGTLEHLSAVTPSDERLKKEIEPLQNALTKVAHLRGVTYSWRTEGVEGRGFPEGTQIGLIAQEVEAVIPEVIHTTVGGYKGIDYQKLVPLLIEAVKEQQVRLEAQHTEIARLRRAQEVIALQGHLISRLTEEVETLKAEMGFRNTTAMTAP
jgi:hypothetical protein